MDIVSTIQETNHINPNNENNNNADVRRKCSFCSKDITAATFISWEFMNFCDENCISKYQKHLSSKCSNCPSKIQETSFGKYYQRLKNYFAIFCTKNCFIKYRSSVKICSFCEKVKPEGSASDWIVLRLRVTCVLSAVTFCSQNCYKKFVEMTSRNAQLKIPEGTTCTVCETNEPLSITLEHDDEGKQFFCSQRCLTAFSFVKLECTTEACSMCKRYFSSKILDEHRIYLDNTRYGFCSNTCKNVFVFSNRKITPCAWCQGTSYNVSMITKYSNTFPTILYFCCTYCLKKHQSSTINLKKCSVQLPKLLLTDDYPQSTYHISDNEHQLAQRNVATMCYIQKANRGVSVKPITLNKKLQTEQVAATLLPVPVPIYVPVPMAMYSVPVPFAMPFPIPIPVPFFLPTNRSTSKAIMKDIEKIRSTIPSDPFEAELLNIADMLSGSDPQNTSDSDNDKIEDENVTEMEHSFDLEWALPDSITQLQIKSGTSLETHNTMKRPSAESSLFSTKKSKYDDPVNSLSKVNGMRLDYTLGINAWKQWVSKRQGIKDAKICKSEILTMSPEEFGHALCVFIKELRKPNGDEYAPDTIYYLCLGIQYYLDQNGRFENIFHSEIYEKFTDCLNELAMKFCALYDDESHFIVTRVEEEHLWETRQLGCHSPHVLLHTLIYFNTKYYFRSTVEEHMELSFYHVMKTNKKNTKMSSISLRFYPVSKSSSDRVYEQREDNEDPLRCPVKLYEFYLSKCPEVVKNKFDMMYLKPEKYCTSDSPLWYSAEPLSREALAKVVNRVKMVKEINVALLGNSS